MPSPLNQTQDNQQPSTQTTQNDNKSSGTKGVLIVLAIIVIGIIGILLAISSGVLAAPSWLLNLVPPSMLPPASLTQLSDEEAKLGLMMETGRPGVCTITSTEDETKMTYYIKDEKFKIESTTVQDGHAINSYILNDGEYQYHWTDMETQGTKIKLPSQEETEELEEQYDELAEQYQADWDLEDLTDEYQEEEDQFEVNCQLKNVDDSVFTVAAEIEFTEFGEMDKYYPDEAMDFEVDEESPKNIENLEDLDDDDMKELEQWAEEMEEKFEQQ